jgi:hypothetical protein
VSVPRLDANDVVDKLRKLVGTSVPWDGERAEAIVELAMQRAESVIDPVPARARAIIVDVAVRAYTNPLAATSQAVGPFSTTYQAPGVYLTQRERDDLAALAEPDATAPPRGAFTIHPGRQARRWPS